MSRRLGALFVGVIILIVLGIGGYFIYRYFGGGSGTITIWTLRGNETAVKSVADIYHKKHPGYKVKIVPFYAADFETKALYALAGHKGTVDIPAPDIWIMPNEWVEQHRGALLPAPDGTLDKALSSYQAARPKGQKAPAQPKSGRTNAQIIEQDYGPIAKTDLESGGKVWGIPLDMDTLALLYDKTKVSNPPKTWQEVADLAKRQTIRSGTTITKSAIALGDNSSVTHYLDIVSILMLQSGTKMVDPATKTATFNITDGSGTPPGTATLDFYTSFARPGKDVYTWNQSIGTSIAALKSGKTSMALGYAKDYAGLQSQSNIAVAPLPQTNSSNPQTYGRYLTATVTKQAGDGNNTSKANATWDFVAMFANPDASEMYAKTLGAIPARVDVAARSTLAASLKPFLTQVAQATTWEKEEVKVADGAFNEALDLVLKNNEPPQTALDVAAKAYSTFLQRDTGITTESTVLSLWQPSDDPVDYKSVIDHFVSGNKSVNRIVVSKHTPERYEWEALNAMAARQGPDILLAPHDYITRWSPTLHAFPAGSLKSAQDKSDDITSYTHTYIPAVATDNIINQKIYGIPARIGTMMIAYNNDLYRNIKSELQQLHDEDLNYRLSHPFGEDSVTPVTWEDLKTLVKSAVKKNGTTLDRPFIAVGSGKNVTHAQDIFTAVLKQYGGEVADPDRKVTGIALPFSSSNPAVAGKQAEDLLKSFTNPSADNYTWNSSQPNSLDALADGKVVAAFIYPQDIAYIKSRNPLITLTFSAMPQLSLTQKPVDMAAYNSLTIPISSKNPSQALSFILTTLDPSSFEQNNDELILVDPKKEDKDTAVADRRGQSAPQFIQKNSAQSYYKGYFPSEVDAALIGLMDGSFSLDQAANKINNSLKKKVL